MNAHDNSIVPAHLACQTQFSRTGERNMVNRKPYRTKARKRLAQESAVKCEDGAWRTDAPVSYHSRAMDR